MVGLGPKLPQHYTLRVQYPNVQLLAVNNGKGANATSALSAAGKVVATFPVTLIKKYGMDTGNFQLELSRRCMYCSSINYSYHCIGLDSLY